jgi:hypothetical protein
LTEKKRISARKKPASERLRASPQNTEKKGKKFFNRSESCKAEKHEN